MASCTLVLLYSRVVLGALAADSAGLCHTKSQNTTDGSQRAPGRDNHPPGVNATHNTMRPDAFPPPQIRPVSNRLFDAPAESRHMATPP